MSSEQGTVRAASEAKMVEPLRSFGNKCVVRVSCPARVLENVTELDQAQDNAKNSCEISQYARSEL